MYAYHSETMRFVNRLKPLQDVYLHLVDAEVASLLCADRDEEGGNNAFEQVMSLVGKAADAAFSNVLDFFSDWSSWLSEKDIGEYEWARLVYERECLAFSMAFLSSVMELEHVLSKSAGSEAAQADGGDEDCEALPEDEDEDDGEDGYEPSEGFIGGEDAYGLPYEVGESFIGSDEDGEDDCSGCGAPQQARTPADGLEDLIM